MKQHYLFIHAPDRDHTFFLLVEGGKVVGRVRPSFAPEKSADLLKHLEKMLKKYSVSPQNIRGVVVCSGPGQFSFLRSGIIIANSFSWALHIPVVGIYGDTFFSEDEFIEQGLKKISKVKKNYAPVAPVYGREPNITKPKKKIFL